MTEVPAGNVYKDRSTTTRGHKVGGWVAEFRWPKRGLRRRWRGRTRIEAVAQMEKYRQELGAGLDPRDTTFDQLADVHIAVQRRRLRAATVAQMEWALGKARPVIGHVLVADLTPSDIEKVMHAAEDEGLGPRSRNAIRKAVRSVMQRGVLDRLVAGNVVDAVKGPKVPSKKMSLPPVAKVDALLDKLREEETPSWPLLWLIASTGMRTGEARSLRWPDVQDDDITVAGQLDREGRWSEPKTEAGHRVIPLTPGAQTALDEMRQRHGGYAFSTTYVFTGPDGKVPAAWTAYKAWSRAQEKHWGETRITVHQLRHLYLSRLIGAGLELPDAAAVAGHADSRILSEVYSHALSDHQARVQEALRKAGVG